MSVRASGFLVIRIDSEGRIYSDNMSFGDYEYAVEYAEQRAGYKEYYIVPADFGFDVRNDWSE